MFQPKVQGIGPDGMQNAKGSAQAKPRMKHFEKDFVILSEFSEQVGPVPVQYIPDESSKGTFDASHFSVRIMTSDYQSATRKLAGEDTQVLLSEKHDQVYAFVHYFSLNDINARGYVRQYCFSYLTSKMWKLVDNFELLKQQFSEVTAMLKGGNHRVFKKDLEHHLADLNHTMAELKEEGFAEVDDMDNSHLYLGFDFTMEDVPERDPRQVESATKETSEILGQLKEEMARKENERTWQEVKRLRKLNKSRLLFQAIKDKPNSSPAMRRVPGFNVGSPDSGSADVHQASFTESIASELTSSTTSSDISHYQPQRVMTHTVHKFERRLRPLEELTSKAFSIAMEKLKKIHKFFSRSEITLEMEREETLLLDPRSSLLSIGRVPMVNFLQNYNHFLSQTPCPLLQPRPYQISCMNTWGQPSEFADGEIVVKGEATGCVSGFDSSFLEQRHCLNRCPLYIDLSVRTSAYDFLTSSYTDNSLNQSTRTATFDMVGNSPKELHPPDRRHPAAGLTAHHDDDRTSRGSADYMTPVTGLTPPSGDEKVVEGVEDVWVEQDTIKKASHITDSDLENQQQLSADTLKSLDNGTRTPSNHSFSSAVETTGSTLSLQSDIFSGKTPPTITTSEVTARAEVPPRARSLSPQSPSPLTNSTSINGDVCTERPMSTESWEDWGAPNNPPKYKEKWEAQNISQPPKYNEIQGSPSDRRLDGEQPLLNEVQEEELHSVGSELFGTRLQSPGQTTSDLSERVLEKANGYPGALEQGKKPLGLPGGLSTEKVSPERYYSPTGGPPGVFGENGLLSPSRVSLVSQVSTASALNTYRGPSLVELRGKGKLPLVSSVDLIESEFKFKPGRGIFAFCKDNTSIKDLFYCLLHGRPLAVVGKPNDENHIRRVVRLLWMLVPGHSSKQQIITWQDNPLNAKDLSRVKLIGLSHKAIQNMGQNVKRHISYWDISTGKVYTPPYHGELLKPIVSRTKDRKNEQVFVAYLLSVLLDLSMKAYIYYHCYCASSVPSRMPAIGETTARVHHKVHQRDPRDSPHRHRAIFLQHLNVRHSDIDIIEYLVDIIREQQLTEWRNGSPGGSPHDDDPVTFKLYTKQCKESTHKPSKRPY